MSLFKRKRSAEDLGRDLAGMAVGFIDGAWLNSSTMRDLAGKVPSGQASVLRETMPLWLSAAEFALWSELPMPVAVRGRDTMLDTLMPVLEPDMIARLDEYREAIKNGHALSPGLLGILFARHCNADSDFVRLAGTSLWLSALKANQETIRDHRIS